MLSASSDAYDFISPNAFDVSKPTVEVPLYNEAVWDLQLQKIQAQIAADRLLDYLSKARVQSMMTLPTVTKPDIVAEAPKEEDVVIPVNQEFEGIASTDTTLPDIDLPDIDIPKLEEPIKVVIHTTPTCVTCHAYLVEAVKLKDAFNIVVESHNYSDKTSYGTWLNAFPVTEVIKGDKCVKVKVGYMSTDDLKKFLESIE